MIKRTLDAAFLNSVANSEGVREFFGGEGYMDLTPMISNPENVALQDGCGGFVAEKLAPGLYECHSMFLPEGRGFGVQEAMRQSLRFMFTETDCTEIVTRVGVANKAAHGLALRAGFVKAFCRDNAEYMSLSYWAWLRGDDEIEKVGRRNSETDEPVHNRALGAFLLMCMAGNAAKGTLLFNRWAKIVRVPPIQWRL